jgi:TonB family protein
LSARHAVLLAALALAGQYALAQATASKNADPTATELFVVPGIGKHRLPVGDCPAPSWPREALRYELEGTARVRYQVLPDGRVGELGLVKSSGWAILDDATLALARSCRYTPQQALEVQGRELPLEFTWRLEGERVYANMLPATCGAAGRIDGFQPFDRQPGDVHAVKVRFLVDKTGAPRGIRLEGNSVDPVLADEVIGYLGNCRFEFDPQAKGAHTDTMYGRVLLR